MKNKLLYITLGLIPIVLWGSSFLGTKVLLQQNFTANIITFSRFLIATLMMFIFKYKKIRKTKIEKKDRKYIFLMAFFGISLFYFFENSGIKYTTVSNTGLITSTIPFFTLISAHFFFHKKITMINFVGIILGLLGTFVLFANDLSGTSLHLKGDLLIFASVGMWVIYSFAYKKIMAKYSSIIILFEIFFWGTIFLIPMVSYDFFQSNDIIMNFDSILSLLFLSVFCSFFAYLMWNVAVRNIGVKISSNLILLIPIVSIFVGVVFLDETFNKNVFFSAILIIFGAYLTSKSTPLNEF